MLGQIVVSSEEIQSMLDRLAAELDADLEGKAPVFIGVLKGCVFFLTDLTRRLQKSVELDFIQVSSYGASTTSSVRHSSSDFWECQPSCCWLL